MQVVEARYLTTREIAERLRVHEATVRRWLEAGALKGVRLPGGWRVSEESIRDFLEKRQGGDDES